MGAMLYADQPDDLGQVQHLPGFCQFSCDALEVRAATGTGLGVMVLDFVGIL
jgi:hypothetical protein